jgi:hypothetical protein
MTPSEHVKGTLFYIISQINSSSKFKVTEKCEIFPGQDSLKWTLLAIQFAVFMKQTQFNLQCL